MLNFCHVIVHLILKNNLIILGSGDKSIRFRPHLNVSKVDIDFAFFFLFILFRVLMTGVEF